MASITLTGVSIGRRVSGDLREIVGGIISADPAGRIFVPRGWNEHGRSNE